MVNDTFQDIYGIIGILDTHMYRWYPSICILVKMEKKMMVLRLQIQLFTDITRT